MNPDSSLSAQLTVALKIPPLSGLSPEHCRRCQAALPLFITDEMAGLMVDVLYPQTAVHLDICPNCAREYEELVFLTRSAFYDKDAL